MGKTGGMFFPLLIFPFIKKGEWGVHFLIDEH
jgi:hypothetical protein